MVDHRNSQFQAPVGDSASDDGGGGGREDGKPYDALSNHHKLIVILKTINDINFKYPLIIASFSESKLTKIIALI